MNISFTFKNFEPSDHLRKYAERRFAKLGRFANKSDNVEMTVLLTVDKFRHKADVQFSGDSMNFSAVEQSSDMYATVDMVLDKLEAQLKKHAERVKERRKGGGKVELPEGPDVLPDLPDEERYIIEEDRFNPKPLHVDEAALQLDSGDDAFLVFLNAETGRVNVMYHRKNGHFGLIDPNI